MQSDPDLQRGGSHPLLVSTAKVAQTTEIPAQTAITERHQDEDTAEPPHLMPSLDRIEANYRAYIEAFRRRDMPTAADNLEHFLAGSGEPRRLPREEMIKLKPLSVRPQKS